MPSFLRNEVILVRFPYSDLSDSKVRPAIVVSGPHSSRDIFLVPLTSKTGNLRPGEFLLSDWSGAGLNVPSALKRGIFSLQESLVLKSVGHLQAGDVAALNRSLLHWIDLK